MIIKVSAWTWGEPTRDMLLNTRYIQKMEEVLDDYNPTVRIVHEDEMKGIKNLYVKGTLADFEYLVEKQ